MTNYIEEMMLTAGIEQEEEKYCFWECRKPELENVPCVNTSCKFYRHKILPFPDFTPEKQLEIIKLIGKTKDFNCFWSENDKEWFFSAGLTLPICFDFQESNKDFSQALAQLTTELMKAGELDKEKVKEILE